MRVTLATAVGVGAILLVIAVFATLWFYNYVKEGARGMCGGAPGGWRGVKEGLVGDADELARLQEEGAKCASRDPPKFYDPYRDDPKCMKLDKCADDDGEGVAEIKDGLCYIDGVIKGEAEAMVWERQEAARCGDGKFFDANPDKGEPRCRKASKCTKSGGQVLNGLCYTPEDIKQGEKDPNCKPGQVFSPQLGRCVCNGGKVWIESRAMCMNKTDNCGSGSYPQARILPTPTSDGRYLCQPCATDEVSQGGQCVKMVNGLVPQDGWTLENPQNDANGYCTWASGKNAGQRADNAKIMTKAGQKSRCYIKDWKPQKDIYRQDTYLNWVGNMKGLEAYCTGGKVSYNNGKTVQCVDVGQDCVLNGTTGAVSVGTNGVGYCSTDCPPNYVRYNNGKTNKCSKIDAPCVYNDKPNGGVIKPKAGKPKEGQCVPYATSCAKGQLRYNNGSFVNCVKEGADCAMGGGITGKVVKDARPGDGKCMPKDTKTYTNENDPLIRDQAANACAKKKWLMYNNGSFTNCVAPGTTCVRKNNSNGVVRAKTGSKTQGECVSTREDANDNCVKRVDGWVTYYNGKFTNCVKVGAPCENNAGTVQKDGSSTRGRCVKPTVPASGRCYWKTGGNKDQLVGSAKIRLVNNTTPQCYMTSGGERTDQMYYLSGTQCPKDQAWSGAQGKCVPNPKAAASVATGKNAVPQPAKSKGIPGW